MAVGISRQTAYNWREDIPEFADAWDKAMRVGVSALEDEAHRRAFDGLDKPLTHQGQFTYLYRVAKDEDGNPVPSEITGQPKMEPVLDEHGNHKIAAVKEYSDTLAIFLLKAHSPEKYRENSRVDIGNADNKPFEITDAQAAAKLASIIAAGQARKAAEGDVEDLL